jgi:hypothetical protein
MPSLENEIDTNHQAFFRDWTAQATRNWGALRNNEVYRSSYRRLCALQAIKSHIVVPNYSQGSAAFFIEAHNDALVSHVSASIGAWRAALQSLRSCIENVLCAVYYREHPVEFELWSVGKFYISFAELIRYAERHPRLNELGTQITGLAVLHSEYATLSKAVHASAVNFRMTDPVSAVLLWSTDPVRAAMWSAREKKVIEAICLLMICLHSQLLQGTRLTPLRNVLRLSISTANRTRLRQRVRVNIC